MKTLLFLLVFLPFAAFTQNCVQVDSIWVTAKVRELGNRNIKFGMKQILEDELSQKYCLSEEGTPIFVEVYYFGIPKTSIRIAGVERTNTITQVGVRLYYLDKKYEGLGESDTEIRAVMIEVKEGTIPFEKMTVSSALKKAIHEAVILLP
jgi:hypothetical protein